LSRYATQLTLYLMDHARCLVRPREKYSAGLRIIGNLSVNNPRRWLQFKEPFRFECISFATAKGIKKELAEMWSISKFSWFSVSEFSRDFYTDHA
jgi:hypothetical protein